MTTAELSTFRARLEARKRQGLLPSKQRRSDLLHWWRTVGLPALGLKLLDVPIATWREIKGPIKEGLWKGLDQWSAWRAVAELDEALKTEGVHPDKKLKVTERRFLAKRSRNIITFCMVALFGAAWFTLARYHMAAPVAMVIVIGAFLDFIGRRGDRDSFRKSEPVLLQRGVPLRQLAMSVLTLLDQQFEVPGLVSEHVPMIWDDRRLENTITLQCSAEINDKHLRQLERSMGGAPYSMRITVDPHISTYQTLHIKRGNALENVPKAPWWESLSKTIMDAVYVGVSNTDVPFALHVAGAHALCVMKTGGGKTKGFLWSLIWGLSACRDVVICGIDLRRGPGLRIWGDVIRPAAYTPEAALALLARLLEIMEERHELLARFAEDDDPANDRDEWHPSLGPFICLLMDEFSDVSAIAPLREMLERLIRNGAKVGISLVMCTQKEGTSDLGSTLLQTQVSILVVGACSPRDSVNLFGVEMRDAGWKPHLLNPAIRGGPIRDAGCCYVRSPSGHETPDLYRCFTPFTTGEVKARRRQRTSDELPELPGLTDLTLADGASLEQPAAGLKPVPQILTDTATVFEQCDRPDFLPTEVLLEHLEPLGWELSADELAAALRDADLARSGQRHRHRGGNPTRGYIWSDVKAALARYDTAQEVAA